MIVKLDILNQNTLQVTLVEYKERVNTFIAHRADPTLGKCIGLGVCGGVNTISIFSATNTVSKAVLNLPS